jgi:hypothetical protein
MRGRLTALSMLAGIIVPASTALAGPPHQPKQAKARAGGIGIRLADVPADSHDPLARSYIVDRLAPGTSIRRRVEISNTTRSTADISVYPAAAGLRRGTFGFAPNHSRNELSSWTTVSRDVLRLQPGSKTFETLAIAVPKEAPSGERYAVIWAEVSAPAPAAGGITLVNRVGIRMYLSIGPGGAPSSNFAIASLTARRSATGEPLVVTEVHNSGRRTLDISGNLTLSKGPGGLRAGPLPARLGTALAPGESKSLTVTLDKRLPRGPWRAHVRLTSGRIQRSATATLTFPRHAGAASVASAGSRRLVLVVIILLLLLAGSALSILLRYVRRSRVQPVSTADASRSA